MFEVQHVRFDDRVQLNIPTFRSLRRTKIGTARR